MIFPILGLIIACLPAALRYASHTPIPLWMGALTVLAVGLCSASLAGCALKR